MLHCLPCGVGDVGFSLELSFGDDFTSIIIYIKSIHNYCKSNLPGDGSLKYFSILRARAFKEHCLKQ